MNKILKTIIATFGALNLVNNFAMPVVISLLWIDSFGITRIGDKILIVVLFGASLYQAFKNLIKLAITDGEK